MKSHCEKTPTALCVQSSKPINNASQGMTTKITNYKALTFDCYGTLIDWESGIWDAMQPLLLLNNVTIDRAQGLEAFAIIETQQELDTPDMLYPELLTRVHGKIAQHFNLNTSPSLNSAFGQSVPHWPAFPDSADALRLLKKHFKLVILSNVDQQGFAASNRKLGVEFDAVYTAQDVGSYKPDPNNFEYLIKQIKSDLNISPDEILHTAQSMHHDHVPADKAGLARCWIDRQDLANNGNWGATAEVSERPHVDYRFTTLMQMAEQVIADS